ncbi:hypothetical protein CXB51_024426 [Gossypium anomalum]|uniref:H(+)-transporting two-sector ATPase n=1 Tax=Gossypium anomalum TaxID=47600 RepID=A0A8J5Y606_9ROSI|nr:hypothetical protein CXB51_024426 [Gossypium anomalum]
MRIRIQLDVSTLLKRKKKIQIRKDMIVYAQFKYEKLSLLCFIYGRLGHGESYCPYHLRIEPSKIVFSWDLSLRAVPKRRDTGAALSVPVGGATLGRIFNVLGEPVDNLGPVDTRTTSPIHKSAPAFIQLDSMVMSRWLRDVDGSQYKTVNLESPNQSILLNEGKEAGQKLGRNWSKGGTHNDGLEYGPMDLVSEEENVPIAMLEGKKRQHIVEAPLVIASSNAGFKGRLSLGWKGNSLINLKSFSSFHIDVEIHDNEGGDIWRLTGFYGNLEEKYRRDSWNLLRMLSHD